jgi:inner membrane protein
MDPITHTLTGLAMSRAGLKRVAPYATPVLLLAAVAPDLDLLVAPFGSLAYLHWHRHLTHTFAAAPVLAILPVLVVGLLARKRFDWKRAYLLSLAAVLLHVLMDWLAPYGTRFLLPFSANWYRLDTVALPDAWILTVFLVAALAPALSRLVSSEIGARASTGRGWAIFALCFLALFSFGRWVLHERAVAVLDARLYGGSAPLRVAAIPGPFNPFRWTGLVETPEFYSLYDVNLLDEFNPAEGQILYKPEPSPLEAAAARAAERTEAFRVFLDFSAYPYWRFSAVEKPADSIRVEVMDLRFGSPGHPQFVASAIVDSGGRVLESDFSFQPRLRR